MLRHAREFLDGVGVDDIVRIDVPGRGAGEDGSGTMRGELDPAVPVLQSASLFGGVSGLELVDAHQLNSAEAEILAELVGAMDEDAVALAVVAAGALPSALKKALEGKGEKVTVKRMRERDSRDWLAEEVMERGMKLDRDALDALIARFGTDIASMGQALDQLADTTEAVTPELIVDRFKNRPNEPTWLYTNAVTKGDVGEALRRLGDLLTYTHPLVLLSALESEVRRRAIALSAGDIEEFRSSMGARSSDRSIEFLWRNRSKMKDSSLRQATDALVRADRILKSAPEPLHRVTMERLTVAMSRWMAGR